MKRTTNGQIARAMLPYATTILSLSLAVTLRIERSCSDGSTPASGSPPPVIYPYAEIVASGAEASSRIPRWPAAMLPECSPDDGSCVERRGPRVRTDR